MTSRPTDIVPNQPLFATLGVFDGVHRGHRAVIARVEAEAVARQLASAVISFRTHPQQVLHPEVPFRLLTSPDEREALLRQTGVDRVIFLDFTREMSMLSAFDFLRVLSSQYRVKGLIIGYDHRFGHNRAEGFDDYVKYGKELGMEILHAEELVTDAGPVSSSIIRKLLLQGDLATANHLLSYPYTLHGHVVNGFHVGRELGFPTANIDIDYPDKLITAGLATFLNMDFNHWSFGTNRKPQLIRAKLKVKKATYYKLIFYSVSASATATILSADIQVRYTGNVK